MTRSWLRTPAPQRHPRLRLVCFPHAGGSAGFFTPWLGELPDSVELTAVQYPGRAERVGEPVPGHLDDLARPVAGALAERVAAGAGDAPLAFFGHDMGAALAFETARLLSARQPPCLRALFVSAHPAPTDGHHRPRRHRAAEPLAVLRRLTGAEDVPQATAHADLQLAERYRYRPGTPLDCAVTALVGTRDADVTTLDAEGWRSCTTGPFTLRAMPGDHFYLVPRRAELVAFLLTSLGAREGLPAGRGRSATP
ncbi:thioesterase [Streptomyces sp. JB150]|nr:thioesterase [Streptomyces sp. JB150]